MSARILTDLEQAIHQSEKSQAQLNKLFLKLILENSVEKADQNSIV